MKKAACASVLICLLLCSTGSGEDDTSGNVADIENGKKATESLLQQTEGAESIVQRSEERRVGKECYS